MGIYPTSPHDASKKIQGAFFVENLTLASGYRAMNEIGSCQLHGLILNNI